MLRKRLFGGAESGCRLIIDNKVLQHLQYFTSTVILSEQCNSYMIVQTECTLDSSRCHSIKSSILSSYVLFLPAPRSLTPLLTTPGPLRQRRRGQILRNNPTSPLPLPRRAHRWNPRRRFNRPLHPSPLRHRIRESNPSPRRLDPRARPLVEPPSKYRRALMHESGILVTRTRGCGCMAWP